MAEPMNALEKNTDSSEISNSQSCEDLDLTIETDPRHEVIKNVQLQSLAIDTDHIHSVDHIARLERHRRLAKLVSILVFVATIAGIISLFIRNLSQGCYEDLTLSI